MSRLIAVVLLLGACASGTTPAMDAQGGTPGGRNGGEMAGAMFVAAGGQGGEVVGGASGDAGAAGMSAGGTPMTTTSGGTGGTVRPPRDPLDGSVEANGCGVGPGCDWAPCGRVTIQSDNGTTSVRSISCGAGLTCAAAPSRVLWETTPQGQVWLSSGGTCVRTCTADADCKTPPRGTCSWTMPVCSNVPRSTGVCSHIAAIANYKDVCPGLLP